MPNYPTIQLKRKATGGAPASLSFGEVAMGDGDGLLYAGRNSGAVVAVAGLPSAFTARVVSTAALAANTYANGTLGVGATLTANTNGALSVDGVSVSVGDLVLVTAESTGANNGLYAVTAAGGAGAPYVLTRATRMNTTDQFVGASVWVVAGSAFAGTLWYCTNATAPTVGSTSVTFANQAATFNMQPKGSVDAATTTTLPANTYANGSSGAGATLTGNVNGAIGTIDGVTITASMRILVKNEATGANNGIYTVTTVGDAGTKYVLTRSTDFDYPSAPVGALVYVQNESGSSLGNTIWACQATGNVTYGSTSISFTQLAGLGSYVQGTGITITGNSIALSTPVAMQNGGTGLSTTTAYGVICAGTSSTGAFQNAGAGTSGQALVSGGASALPSFGTLGVPGGGTGIVTTTAYGVICGGTTATGALQNAGAGTSGKALVSGGASALPSFGTLGVTGGGTGLATTTAYGVICGGTTATGNFQNAGAGTAGQGLVSNGASALPSFGTVLVNGGGTGLATTTAYGLICGGTTATGAFQNAGAGSAGQALVSNGASALPSFGTLGVAGGGTGLTSTTAYGVLCGGTTTTGAMQNAGAGTAGQMLMSNGVGALPTWSGIDGGTYA